MLWMHTLWHSFNGPDPCPSPSHYTGFGTKVCQPSSLLCNTCFKTSNVCMQNGPSRLNKYFWVQNELHDSQKRWDLKQLPSFVVLSSLLAMLHTSSYAAMLLPCWLSLPVLEIRSQWWNRAPTAACSQVLIRSSGEVAGWIVVCDFLLFLPRSLGGMKICCGCWRSYGTYTVLFPTM